MLDLGAHGIRGVVTILMVAVIGYITLLAYFGFGGQVAATMPVPTNGTLADAWNYISGGFTSVFKLSPTLLILGIFVAIVGFLALAGRIGWSWFAVAAIPVPAVSVGAAENAAVIAVVAATATAYIVLKRRRIVRPVRLAHRIKT